MPAWFTRVSIFGAVSLPPQFACKAEGILGAKINLIHQGAGKKAPLGDREQMED